MMKHAAEQVQAHQKKSSNMRYGSHSSNQKDVASDKAENKAALLADKTKESKESTTDGKANKVKKAFESFGIK